MLRKKIHHSSHCIFWLRQELKKCYFPFALSSVYLVQTCPVHSIFNILGLNLYKGSSRGPQAVLNSIIRSMNLESYRRSLKYFVLLNIQWFQFWNPINFQLNTMSVFPTSNARLELELLKVVFYWLHFSEFMWKMSKMYNLVSNANFKLSLSVEMIQFL